MWAPYSRISPPPLRGVVFHLNMTSWVVFRVWVNCSPRGLDLYHYKGYVLRGGLVYRPLHNKRLFFYNWITRWIQVHNVGRLMAQIKYLMLNEWVAFFSHNIKTRHRMYWLWRHWNMKSIIWRLVQRNQLVFKRDLYRNFCTSSKSRSLVDNATAKQYVYPVYIGNPRRRISIWIRTPWSSYKSQGQQTPFRTFFGLWPTLNGTFTYNQGPNYDTSFLSL